MLCPCLIPNSSHHLIILPPPCMCHRFFCKDKRDEIKKGVEGGAPDVAKAMGIAWKALSKPEQQPYIDQAEKDKKRFEKEMEAYTAKPKAAAGAKKVEEEGEGEEEDEESEEEEDE